MIARHGRLCRPRDRPSDPTPPERRITIIYRVETEQEADGRWIAEVTDLSGVLVYGQTREEAVRRVQALAMHVTAERQEHGEPLPCL